MLKNNKIIDSSRIIHEFKRPNGSKISIVKKSTTSIGKSMKAVPKWILYAIATVVVFLGIILAAAIIFINQAPKAASYSENCQGRSCQSGLNLKCINNKCTCLPNQYYLKGCNQKKTNGDKCNKNYECDDSKRLTCNNGFCQCSQAQYWSKKFGTCYDRKSFDEVCQEDNCLTETQMLKCIDGICQCDSTRFWTDKVCSLKNFQGEKCFKNNECDDTQALLCRNGLCGCDPIWEYYCNVSKKCLRKLNESEICTGTQQCLGQLQCLSGVCSCGTYIYFEAFNLSCIPQVKVNESCQKEIQCRLDLGLTCQSNKCQCMPNVQVWYNETKGCVDYFNYSSIGCARDSHCQPGKSLICNFNPSSNQCDCPSTSTNAMCDCKRVNGNEFYWNGTSCIAAKSEFSSCINSYECLKPMDCNSTSNTCLCPFTQYYDSTTYSCRAKSLNAGSCSSNWTCREDLGLYCSSGSCTCPTATQFWHSTNSICRNYFVYGEIGCSANSECTPSKSLICNTNPSSNNCTCPILSQTNMCDCQRTSGNEYYWDGTRCISALPFDSVCTNTYECQSLTKGLECNSTMSKCYCMKDWSYFNGKCYRIFVANGACSSNCDETDVFPKCPAQYLRSQMAIVSSAGIFNFLKSLDSDINKANFKDSYIGGYFKNSGTCLCFFCENRCNWRWSCSITLDCKFEWKWIDNSNMATSASTGSWCTGSTSGYYNQNNDDFCVRIDATSGDCFTNKACSDNKNFICEYPI